jgi:hypothetical protein
MPGRETPKFNKEGQSKNSLKERTFMKFKIGNMGLGVFMYEMNQALSAKDKKPVTLELKSVLTKNFKIYVAGFKQYNIEYNKFLKSKSKIISAPLLKAFKRLIAMKRALESKLKAIKLKHRIIDERKAKAEYKKTSIEKIKFRSWKDSDITGFSKFVSTNAGNKTKLTKLLKDNKYLWNPKGNPELYFQQQCVETAVLLLIHYCFKNKIDLALPASRGHKTMSNYNNLEDYMKAVYPKLSASHLFSGGGGMLKQISKEEVKPGDIYTSKHPTPPGGYHAQMVIANNKEGLSYLAGNQSNNDFINDPGERVKVEAMYPIGFIDPQPNASPKQVKNSRNSKKSGKMRWGGYAYKPRIKLPKEEGGRPSLAQNERSRSKSKDEIKFYRINPKGMNNIINRIA